MIRLLFFAAFACLGFTSLAQRAAPIRRVGVLVVGGGTGGTAAGIASARQGANTLIVEAGPWLGGMISAAGVTATDGNHRLPSGLWNEFRNHIYKVYGGPKAVETGWVSNTQFEPRVSDSIFKSLAAAEQNLQVMHGYVFDGLAKQANEIVSVRFRKTTDGSLLIIQPKMVIDATELGDVLKAAGEGYDLGMEAGSKTGETVGITASNNIVQDLTYVAVLKDFGKGANKTIGKPAGYDPKEFDGACTNYYVDKRRKAPTVDAQKMLDYGRLPNGKYMLNWPGYGNDTYLNVVEMSEAQRQAAYQKAKQTTLRFVYFIQTQLGYQHLGLADDEFPTKDKLALMPYHREGRRLQGLVRLTMRHIAEPFTYGHPLYRTGISVGDYPIDHHHKKNPAAPQHLEFYPIPSYSIPLGALIPKKTHNLVVAEKAISVSNVANGTTRLQPVVMLTGQAAGTLAALAFRGKIAVQKVPIRGVQQALLDQKAFLMPYLDVVTTDPAWESIQRIGATGILRGRGIPFKWANQTWFYPDSAVQVDSLRRAIRSLLPSFKWNQEDAVVTTAHLPNLLRSLRPFAGMMIQVEMDTDYLRNQWANWGLKNFADNRPLSRLELAVVLDKTINPFSWNINHQGRITLPQNK